MALAACRVENGRVSRPTPDLRTLGRVLRTLRKAKSLTQEQLSFKTGLTTALISDSENGKRNLSFESIERVLAALGATWEEFGLALNQAAKARRGRSSG
jgi:transcriptional regulator with XRE-family HTH domain